MDSGFRRNDGGNLTTLPSATWSWPAPTIRGRTGCKTVQQPKGPGNCSELSGNQQRAASREGVETLGPPDAEEGRQGHFATAALSPAGPAADFPADYPTLI